MKEIEKLGDLPSKTWCPNCGIGKELKAYETFGFPTSRVIETLQWIAIKHERQHPTHEPQVIIYRATWLD